MKLILFLTYSNRKTYLGNIAYSVKILKMLTEYVYYVLILIIIFDLQPTHTHSHAFFFIDTNINLQENRKKNLTLMLPDKHTFSLSCNTILLSSLFPSRIISLSTLNFKMLSLSSKINLQSSIRL